ncbi:MAG: diaminopimelate epimerase [Candidatus Hydrothermarchaeales archaeon]
MRFFKYHGTGNDFILIDNRTDVIKEEEKGRLATKLCDRHFGVGGDGIIFVEPSTRGDAKMRIFNPDGSEAEICGNGIRCVGLYLYETGMKKERLLIETVAGLKEIGLTIEGESVAYVTVDMGAPKDVALSKRLEIDGKVIEYSFVDMGVPHVVIFVEDIDVVDVEKTAPAIRFNPLFPKGTNVNFVQKINKKVFKIRTYERGVEKETLACGTGITASGAASVFLGHAEESEEMKFQAKGGRVFVMLKRENSEVRMFMRGSAEFVFEGEVPINFK